jgi:hypothetical protein
MSLKTPDRVPVMCQLSIGHYFLHSGIAPIDIWYTSEGFANALDRLCRRYRFDGILINLPGRDPNWESHVKRIDRGDTQDLIYWNSGRYTVLPHDDLPHVYQRDGSRYFPSFGDVTPETLYYIDNWNLSEIDWPFTWDFDAGSRAHDDYFPAYFLDTAKAVLRKAQPELSVHVEILSPWSQFMELLGYETALTAILMDPDKVKACLAQLTRGAIDWGTRNAALGVDALLISSAFAGAGFLSRESYREFVLPFERELIRGIKAQHPMPIYTHTCGRIGDRLDLMLETGLDGIDTLDPPPLGDVQLEDAKQQLAGKAFIKGNIDAVNTLLGGSLEDLEHDVKRRLEIGKQGGGYILSTACSVAPHTAPERIELLATWAEECGSL